MAIAVEKSFQHFLDNSFQNYGDGEWVAIYGENVVAHGLNLKKVLEDVKRKSLPVSAVLISKVKKTASYL
ncbi:MAG TPA: DUF5678 domain-containing protein [archaeon]|nr:DUF5678 domain-containing protein [archaeon]